MPPTGHGEHKVVLSTQQALLVADPGDGTTGEHRDELLLLRLP